MTKRKMNVPRLEPTLELREGKEENYSPISYNAFKKRTCIRFVAENPKSHKCFCGFSKVEHSEVAVSHDLNTKVGWDPECDTVSEPTDAYGRLEFIGTDQISRAKYIRVANNTDPSNVLRLMIEKWNLKPPKLLISVTGGAKDFSLHPKLKQVIRQGLLKAARTTGAWIFTGGTNTGVMKHVGEAVRGQSVTSVASGDDQLKLIGIATWGIVKWKEELVTTKRTVTYRMTSSIEKSKACLDNNHTHFILVDDGTNGKYGKEIAFRASLENVISRKKIAEDKPHGIPVVLLVIEGGPNTIQTVREAVTKDPPVPVVITEGTGRAADIISFALRINIDSESYKTSRYNAFEQELMHKIRRAYPNEKEKQLLNAYEDVKKCMNQKRYITIFRINEEGVDIDKAILRALFQAQLVSPTDQLSLALVWNRVDIAKSDIFEKNKNWQIEELECAMLDALSNDRVEFVKLLQENRVSIEYFLTKDRLRYLYEKRFKVSTSLKQLICRETFKNSVSEITLEHINKFINRMLGGKRKEKLTLLQGVKRSTIGMLKADPDSADLFENPYEELFLWAVLCNMQKMALFMWERGDSNLARALIGARIYMAMAQKIENKNLRNDVDEELIAHAQEFKHIALAFLDECFQADELYAQKLLIYDLKDWCGHSCLALAVALNHEEFVAHTACQTLLSEIWMGRLNNMPMWKILLGIFVPPTILFLGFNKKKKMLSDTQEEYEQDSQGGEDSDGSAAEGEEELSSEMNNTMTTSQFRCNKYTVAPSSKPPSSSKNRRLSAWRKFYEFYCAPVTKFCINVVAYLVFLMLFSYVILVEEGSDRGFFWEILLIVFLVSLGVEELRQIIQSHAFASDNRLKAWASSKWNICDGIAVLLFFVGMGLRFHGPTKHIGHVIYSLDIMLWIIRLLDIFSVNKNLGPYVVMIGRMVLEMLYFLIIMMVFLLAYGVAQHAILFPNQKATWSLVPMIFFRPYFQTYGELFITDPLQLDDRSTEFSTPKQNEYGGRITIVILALYLLVANILLLNLLIAIFNHIFSEVRAHAKQIWKFQQYWLIVEYAQRPAFAVPPFNLLYHACKLFRCLWKENCLCCRRDVPRRKQYCLGLAGDKLKLRLENKQLEELMLFEEYRLYCYLYKKEKVFKDSSKQRLKVVSERVETISTQLKEMAKKNQGAQRDELQTGETACQPTTICETPRDEHDSTGHVNLKGSLYPMSNVERFPLSVYQVDWKVLVPGYNPRVYTADNILHGTLSADPDIQSGSSKDVWLSFNDFDGNINRQSYVGIYDVIQGLPRNPMGRTGLAGRGLLEHWGPNHVDLHVITRWRKIRYMDAEEHNKERDLEFVAVKSRDNHQWRIPENKSTVDKAFSTAFKKRFCESILSSSGDGIKREKKRQLERFFRESGIKVFRGYCNDERNTDNAWMETIVTNYHDETGEILGSADFVDQGGPQMMTWLVVSNPQTLTESELKVLKKVSKLHNQGQPMEATQIQNGF